VKARINPAPDEELKWKHEGVQSKSAGGCYRSSLVHQNGTRNILKESKVDLCRKDNSLKFWSSAASKDYHKHTPLLVNPIVLFYLEALDGANDSIEVQMDDKAQLGMILAQNRKLPGTWYYSSIHVLVNKARVKRGVTALIRRIELDDLARKRAEEMALFEEAQHEEDGLVEFQLHPYRRFGGECMGIIRFLHNLQFFIVYFFLFFLPYRKRSLWFNYQTDFQQNDNEQCRSQQYHGSQVCIHWGWNCFVG